jgi:hypothetical protein
MQLCFVHATIFYCFLCSLWLELCLFDYRWQAESGKCSDGDFCGRNYTSAILALILETLSTLARSKLLLSVEGSTYAE